MRGSHLLGVSLVFVAAACDGGAAVSTTMSTTTSVLETTSTLANPFLDLIEEESNFSAGDVIDVVGLPIEDQNWVGSFPADDVEFFGRLWEFDRLDAGLLSLGTAASYLGGDVWESVEIAGREPPGFFPQQNTGVIGDAEDITAEAADLAADSADELLTLVATTIAGPDGLDPIQITRREFGGRELYYDLIGGDEPTSRGYRLRVVIEETEDTFGVVLVERSIICVRAVTDGGLCG